MQNISDPTTEDLINSDLIKSSVLKNLRSHPKVDFSWHAVIYHLRIVNSNSA